MNPKYQIPAKTICIFYKFSVSLYVSPKILYLKLNRINAGLALEGRKGKPELMPATSPYAEKHMQLLMICKTKKQIINRIYVSSGIQQTAE